jgi:hypothetical protein
VPAWHHQQISGRQEHHQMPTWVTRISATTSLLLALGAGVGLVLWPCAYQGVEVEAQPAPGGTVHERQLCATLIQANGIDVLGVLALPVLLAGVGLVAVHGRRRGILTTVLVALVAFCLLALASVGLFYLPAAAALVIAVVGWRQQPNAPPSG